MVGGGGGVVGVRGGQPGGLEKHHHERDVLGLAGVGVEFRALLGGLLDAVDLGEEPQAGAERSVRPRLSSFSAVRERWELPWSKPPAALAARA